MAGEEYTGGSRSCATGTAADARERVPPKGAAGDLADARERVPPVVADAADARERVPPAIREMTGNEICYLPSVEIRPLPMGESVDCQNRQSAIGDFPQRHHPSRNSVVTFHDNRSIMLYVTVVTEKRMPVLSSRETHDIIISSWKAADLWLVGRYMIMPDHIHFFCAPSSYPPPDFHRWMAYWKSLAAKAYWRALGGSRSCATAGDTDARARVPPVVADASDARERVPPARNPPLFQRDCWDRQLRTGESYAQKWEYVRNNPVRKGLVANVDEWPYQGELNVLHWHERI